MSDEIDHDRVSGPKSAPVAPTRRPRGTRPKTRQRASQRAWTPPRRWMPLPQAVEYLGTTATALRKWLERAERDERGRVSLPGDVIAEKRARLWFVGFPAPSAM